MFRCFDYINGEYVESNNKYLDEFNTEVPAKLFDIIKLLNDKNYKTVRSFPGHAYKYNYLESEIADYLEKASEEDINLYLEVNNLSDDYLAENKLQISRFYPDSVSVRIDFDKGYLFECLPNGFGIQYSNKKSFMDNMAFKFHEKGYVNIDEETLYNYRNNLVTKIIRTVDLYNRKPEDVQNELDEIYCVLYEWVKSLNVYEEGDRNMNNIKLDKKSTLIAGRPGSGKSSTMINLIKELVKDNKVLFCSYELSKDRALEKLENLNNLIIEEKKILDEIVEKVKVMEINCLCIDYLQLLEILENKNREEIINTLISLDVKLVVCLQLSKSLEIDEVIKNNFEQIIII